ncbi:MAG: type II toxin-antitoxin system prevent-host-death family antitoxin [Bacillota bacterium]
MASVQEVRDRWSHFIQLVRTTGRSVLVTHMRRPVAALISLDDLELLESHDTRRRARRRRPSTWR